MNRKQMILDKLYSLQRFGIKPGLERTSSLLEFSGNPHLKFPSIHVAGTNGKGSICSMMASILMEAGYKVGLYTSPHLVRFNERILVNGIEISDDEMVELAEKFMVGVEKWGCTFFEITTVMAFEYFARNQVDIAIIETGMGGRFDSTNVLHPLVSIISDIDLDHKEYLGNTLEEIAFEKAGIIKNNVPVIITDDKQEIRDVFIEKARETTSNLIFSNDNFSYNNHKFNPDFSQSFDLMINSDLYSNINLPLPGKHQIRNLCGVLTGLNLIKEKFNFSLDNVINGLKKLKENTGLKGRIDLLSEIPPVILDTGHNPGAIIKLIETLNLHRPEIQKWNFVYGAMSDKDINTILRIISPVCDEIILTQPKIERAFDLQKLYKIAGKFDFNEIHTFPEVPDAIDFAMKMNKPTVIAGSFYLAGEALPVMENLLKDKN